MESRQGKEEKQNTSSNPQILIVDDEEPVRRLLKRILERDDYDCTPAASAAEARSLIEKQVFDLVLCDVKMPGESGVDLIGHILSQHQDTAVVMVSAVEDPAIAQKALEIGAYGYILKPFRPAELRISIANALRRRKLELDNRAHREKLEKTVMEKTLDLREALSKLEKVAEGVIQTMALTLETRDPYTAGHQRRVARLSSAIAEKLNLPEHQIEGLRLAAMIHDLGKISVPAEILSKPTRLTEPEFMLIKEHPGVAYNILKGIEFPWPIAEMVYQHHERMDGSGYPRGLSNGKILLEARILGVADVLEAMASHRPYRPALGVEKAMEEILQNRGTLYDPAVVDACKDLFEKYGANFASLALGVE